MTQQYRMIQMDIDQWTFRNDIKSLYFEGTVIEATAELDLINTQIFEDNKLEKKKEFIAYSDSVLAEYSNSMPKFISVYSTDKGREAASVINDENIPFTDTPYLTKMLNDPTDIVERKALAIKLDNERTYFVDADVYSMNKLEEIQNATNQQELDDVTWGTNEPYLFETFRTFKRKIKKL